MQAICSTFFLAFHEHIHLGQKSLTRLLSSKPIIKSPFMFLFQMRKPNRWSVTRPIPGVKKYLISDWEILLHYWEKSEWSKKLANKCGSFGKQLQMMGGRGGGGGGVNDVMVGDNSNATPEKLNFYNFNPHLSL